jgi:hypothetical protein
MSKYWNTKDYELKDRYREADNFEKKQIYNEMEMRGYEYKGGGWEEKRTPPKNRNDNYSSKSQDNDSSYHSDPGSSHTPLSPEADWFLFKFVVMCAAIAVVGFIFVQTKFFVALDLTNSKGAFTYTLKVLGIFSLINFVSIWIVFYKSSFMRFYVAYLSILGAEVYYLYLAYTTNSFFGDYTLTTLLIAGVLIIAIIPKVSLYIKSALFILSAVFGMYLTLNQFAIIWLLLMSAGLVLFVRKPK